ncbi:unnamed protein product [Diatraea saccharalis]|uniref:SLC12A transporter C-terminal domain-containing protein n=1 Tax=Diatraea saccharalis TaxID=40085 RepID=A0A9N9WL73_9NEOP|nr:unnamed protein product [Diatraea saccharalis]
MNSDSSSVPRVQGESAQERLNELLKLLRIDATTHTVTEWPPLQETKWLNDSDSEENNIYQRVPLSYLQTVNNIMKHRCADGTAVTFVQLPQPPPATASDAVCDQYLKVLDELTKDLSPTILVRGLKSVTSTSL